MMVEPPMTMSRTPPAIRTWRRCRVRIRAPVLGKAGVGADESRR